ncbi:MAG: energy transducer TonB [Salinimicrobium sp.]
MRNFLFVLALLCGSISFAQEGVTVKGNRLTTKEIAPVWPGCSGSEAEKKACFKEKMIAHMKSHYHFPKDTQGNYIRGKAVVSFQVNEQGKVEVLSVEGPKKELNAEARKIVEAMPVMTPGKLAGKPIAVKYKTPFTF